MAISAVNNTYSFKGYSNNSKSNENNPISKTGEKAKLAKATFIAGLGAGAKLLFEVLDGDFVFDTLGNKANEIVEKQHKNISKSKSELYKTGAFIGLILMFIGGFAALYTLFKAPKINYDGNVNAFQKSKDMDVYIKSNDAEKEIYTQMNERAKNSNEAEKAKLREQYMQMQVVKNQVPDFVNLKR